MAKESIDLLLSRSRTKLTLILIDWARNLLVNLFYAARKTMYTKDQTSDDAHIITLISKMSMDLRSQFEQLQKRAPSLFYKSATAIFEFMTASLFKTLTEIKATQVSCGIGEID